MTLPLPQPSTLSSRPVSGDGRGEPLQQRAGFGHAPRDVGLDAGERVRAEDAGVREGFVSQQLPATDRDDGHPGRASGGGHPGRRLAVQGLFVQRALAGDDQPGTRQLVSEAHQAEQHVDAGPPLRGQHGERGVADPPGRPGAGQPRGVRVERRCPPAQRRLQHRDVSEAPFCGAYTQAAPRGPSSGLSTSLASTMRTWRSR